VSPRRAARTEASGACARGRGLQVNGASDDAATSAFAALSPAAARRLPRDCPAIADYFVAARAAVAARPPTPTVQAAPQTGSSVESSSELSGLGLTPEDVRRLGAVADETGYGYGPGTTLPYDAAYDLALGLTAVCESVASGETSWSDQVLVDVGDGAPVDDAITFNGYLEDDFCPSLR
jgi:hypothetical protein